MSSLLRDSVLLRFLRTPNAIAPALAGDDWQLLLRQARRCNLLSRVAWLVADAGLMDYVPKALRYHLEGALLLAASNRRSVLWEINQLQDALGGAHIPFALLKGAAYAASGSTAAQGRVFGDVDILVQRDQLQATERALMQHGWFPTKLDVYDQKYYREWMHELPPMKHVKRQTDLDVHHAILPPTARLTSDAAKVWSARVPVEGRSGVHCLSPVDRIIHSATHLFHEGEFEQGLRDLVDLDTLCREALASSDDFWLTLEFRTIDLGLMRPVFYGLRYARRLLDTPVPDTLFAQATVRVQPALPVRYLMDQLLLRALAPDYLDQSMRFANAARFLLFVRSHYIRMPVRLLIPHLVRKALASEP